MRVAVITTSFDEPIEQLRQCVESVQGQTYPAPHFVVDDRAGSTNAISRLFPHIRHLSIAGPHADWGNAGRAIGALSAITLGFDALCWIDGDNWIELDHVQRMVQAHRESGADVVSATRTIHRLDGSLLFTDQESDGREHCDANCLFVTRAAFRLCPLWASIPLPVAYVGDRLIWQVARALHSVVHVAVPTVCYRTKYAIHYETAGELPPPNAKRPERQPHTELKLDLAMFAAQI